MAVVAVDVLSCRECSHLVCETEEYIMCRCETLGCISRRDGDTVRHCPMKDPAYQDRNWDYNQTNRCRYDAPIIG